MEPPTPSDASTRDNTSVSTAAQGAAAGGYQISSALEEFLDGGSKAEDDSVKDESGKEKLGFYEKKEQSDSTPSEGEEDKEAMLIKEKMNIEDALLESKESFLKQAIAVESQGEDAVDVKPKIQRRLGVGLAALLRKRKADDQSEAGSAMTPAQSEKKGVDVLSDDDDFYGEEAEDDLGVKKALGKKKRKEEIK